MIESLRCALIVVSLLLVFESPLQAYIDPGAGTLLWQALLATFMGGVFYGRRILRRMARLWSRDKDLPDT